MASSRSAPRKGMEIYSDLNLLLHYISNHPDNKRRDHVYAKALAVLIEEYEFSTHAPTLRYDRLDNHPFRRKSEKYPICPSL